MSISVVIPTCNRKPQLLNLLQSLDQSIYPLHEVIIVDSGEDRLTETDYRHFTQLKIDYLSAEKSVCIQRNKGIQQATGEWIFLCDDDMEVPPGYLQLLMQHVEAHPEAGAVSGKVLQKEKDGWEYNYPERSKAHLVWKYIFRLSIWGPIECGDNWLVKRIKKYYRKKGNHISKAGWPVITEFSGDYFSCPVYGLGASLVRRQWLLNSPYEEVLDRHGIGDNYGVAIGFPATGIHVVKAAHVYHHQGPVNRLERPLQYLRRVLALHYFVVTRQELKHVKKGWVLWSLTGNLLAFIFVRDRVMIRPAFRAFWQVAWGLNPYNKAARQKKQRVEPTL
jgi:glycosyltransferase involved in cell wall biosynthesis